MAKSDKGVVENRSRIYFSMRLPEIRGELKKLRTEYKALPMLRSVQDMAVKREAFRRRTYLAERIKALLAEQKTIRSEYKR